MIVTGQATNGMWSIPAGISAFLFSESESPISTVPFPIAVFPAPDPGAV